MIFFFSNLSIAFDNSGKSSPASIRPHGQPLRKCIKEMTFDLLHTFHDLEWKLAETANLDQAGQSELIIGQWLNKTDAHDYSCHQVL